MAIHWIGMRNKIVWANNLTGFIDFVRACVRACLRVCVCGGGGNGAFLQEIINGCNPMNNCE